MITISDVRKKYPQYDKLSDAELTDRLHKKYYGEMPKDQFYEKVGLNNDGSPTGIMDILKKKAIKSMTESNSLIDPLRVVKAGLMGLGEAGQNIAKTVTGGNAPSVDMQELFGMKDPSMIERATSGVAQYAPLLATGGLGLIGDTVAGAAYGLSQSPDEKEKGAMIGGGSSAAFNILNKLLGSSHPLIKTAAKALLGGGVGYELNGDQGAIEGAALNTIVPKLAKKAGFVGDPSADIMVSIKPQEAMVRAKAGNRIGTPLSPGEASARPDITATEARIGKDNGAAAERVKIGQERIDQQKKSIDNLYRKITPSNNIASFDTRKAAQDSIAKMEEARQEAAQPFYDEAHKKRVSPTLITSLEKSDANIANAIDSAMSDPRYQVQGELLGEPKNSIKVLDYAKRKLDAQITQAENFGDNDAVRVLTASKNKLLDKISGFSDDYKQARKIYSDLSKPIDAVKSSQVGRIANMKDTSLKNISQNIFDPSQTDISVLRQLKSHIQSQNPQAWDTIVKNEMNRLMTQGRRGGMTGRSFFDNVLANENRFKQFQVALEHNPEALQHLNDMRTAWEHLINIETPRTAAGQAKTSMSSWRNSVDAIIGAYNNLMGGEKHIQALRYLYSDKWQKDLGKVRKMPKKEREQMLPILLGKTIAPAYLIDGKDKEKDRE